MSTAETPTEDLLKNQVRLLVLGWIRLFIENKIDNIPMEIKFVCKEFFGALIDSKILSVNEESLLLQYVRDQTKKDWNWKLIYRGTQHGFKRDDFYGKCQDKGNTVVIVYNEHEQIFGGYTPCKWENRQISSNKYGNDEAATSFLYILRTICKLGPRLFKLKDNKKHQAVSYHSNTAFDFGHNDFYLYNQRVYTEINNCCYEWYDTKETVYLGGGKIDNGDPKEIEIFELS